VAGENPRVVAFGGGHGLAAALAAWRRITTELTAVVTVADDGGSSGRIRREMPVLPPGDLRMALAALAGDGARGRELAALLQHRLGGTGALAGHPVGNLMLTGLTEMYGGDTTRALDQIAELLDCCGRVLPMADVPLDLVARVETVDPDDPERSRTIRGQVAIAATPGHVREIVLSPADPPVHPAVLERSPRRTSSPSDRDPGTPLSCHTFSCPGCALRWPPPERGWWSC